MIKKKKNKTHPVQDPTDLHAGYAPPQVNEVEYFTDLRVLSNHQMHPNISNLKSNQYNKIQDTTGPNATRQVNEVGYFTDVLALADQMKSKKQPL